MPNQKAEKREEGLNRDGKMEWTMLLRALGEGNWENSQV
jgi:hypothetical protein